MKAKKDVYRRVRRAKRLLEQERAWIYRVGQNRRHRRELLQGATFRKLEENLAKAKHLSECIKER